MTEMNTSSWKEFRLDELFNIETTKGFDKNKIEFADDAPYDFIGRTSVNWGKQGSVNKLESTPNPKNTFSLVQIGETIALWRENEWYASQNIFLLCPKISRIKDVPLYFQTIINKEMSIFGKTYNSYPTLKSLHDTYLKLPVTSSGEIDWQYMQERIAELEQERIAELEQERIAELEHYLVASGLNDYELTEEDKSILATELFNSDDSAELPSENSCRKEARKFRVVDLFDVKNSKNILKSEVDFSKKKHPYVTAQEGNNSVMGYVSYDESFLDKGNCIFIGGKTLVISYQESDFFSNDSHNLLLYLKGTKETSEEECQYLISSLYKSLKPRYNWNGSISKKKIQTDVISLPIQTDTDHNPIIDPENTYHPEGYIPDWSFMEKYIRAVEKVVIKDVVDWKDEEIKKAKELVS